MSSSSLDWEEATFSSEYIEEEQKKIDTKKSLVLQIESALSLYLNTKFATFVDYNLLDEKIQQNIIHTLNKIEMHKDKSISNIILFKLLVFYNVSCRLLCNVTPKNFSFFTVEIESEKLIIKKKTNIVFAIDCQFEVQDLGLFWSNGCTKLLKNLTSKTDDLKNNFYNEIEPEFTSKKLPSNSYFIENDEKILKKLPTSITMFKKHPYYVLESILKSNQAIHPKRPIHGYYKGEAVYSRANIQNLKTEKQLYRLGKKIIDQPYRLLTRNENKIKLYAKWQTTDIQKKGLDSSITMDYFHENHVPIDCVYFDDAQALHVAKTLEIEYRQTCIAVRREPIIKGIFIYKKDEPLFVKTLNEYTAKLKTKAEIEKKEEALFLWNKVIKKVCRYKKIKDRLQ